MKYFIESIQFISQYSLMEKKSTIDVWSIIQNLKNHHQHHHLFSSWRGRNNNFGEWYLNLDSTTQGEIIRIFGIGLLDSSIDDYAKLIEADPVKALFANRPAIVEHLRSLLVFFLNNGIDDHSIPLGTITADLPTGDKCYGNSTNWADFILSLSANDQQNLLTYFTDYLQKKTKTNKA